MALPRDNDSMILPEREDDLPRAAPRSRRAQVLPAAYGEGISRSAYASEQTVSARTDMAQRDPDLLLEIANVKGALRVGLLPDQLCHELLEAFPTPIRRRMVQRVAGLDATVIMSLKDMLNLVNSALNKVVNPDGTAAGDEEDLPMSMKDALNLALRVAQVMTRDLPKVYQVDRLQRREEALARVMEMHMTADQQDALLEELERLEGGSAPE